MHKKYSWRNGKKYGPYYYENKRVGNKVVTTYLGSELPAVSKKKTNNSNVSNWKISLVLTGLLAVGVAIIFFALLQQGGNAGHVVLDMKASYAPQELVSGMAHASLLSEEVIPDNVKVMVGLGEQESVRLLSEVIRNASDSVDADFILDLGEFGIKAENGELNIELVYNDERIAVGSEKVVMSEVQDTGPDCYYNMNPPEYIGTGQACNFASPGDNTCIDMDSDNTMESADDCHVNTECSAHIGASCNYYQSFPWPPWSQEVQSICTMDYGMGGCSSVGAVSGEYGTGLTGGSAANFHSGNENGSCTTGANDLSLCTMSSSYDPSVQGACLYTGGPGVSCDTMGTNDAYLDCVDQTCSVSDINATSHQGSCTSMPPSTAGWACDSAVSSSGFSQDGMCATMSGSCITSGYVCKDQYGMTYQNGCGVPSQCVNGDQCDATLTNGNFDSTYGTCVGTSCVASGGGDSTLPVLGIQSPQNTTYTTTNISINLSATDTNLNTIWFYNGTANLTYSVNTSIIYANGQYTFIAYANDSAGNRNETKVIFVVSVADTTPPTLNFTAPTPANGTSTTNNFVIINTTITDQNDLAEVKFNWNGTNYTLYNNSLILMYNFENLSALGENGTLVVDLSKQGTNGTVIGNGIVNSTGGKYGKGLNADGDGDGVTVSLQALSSYTLEAWINPREINNYDNLFYWATTNTYIGLYNGICAYTSSWTCTTTAPTLNVWTHVVITSAGNVYMNGQLKGTITMESVSGVLSIADRDGSSYDYSGRIDEVKIWNRTLSAGEVYEEYASNLQKFNSTNWELYVNQSKNSTDGLNLLTYTYQAFGKDATGNENNTEQRTVLIGDYVPPTLNFTSPTPVNGTSTTNNFVIVNTTITDQNDLAEVKFNWNGTNYTMYNDSLLMMFNFENRSALGESSSTVIDLSKYKNNASCTNCPTFNTTGKYGANYRFDGSNDVWKVDTLRTGTSWTMSLWVRETTRKDGGANPANGNMIFDTDMTSTEVSSNNGVFTFAGAGNTWRSMGYTIPLDTWTYITFVTNSTSLDLYANANKTYSITTDNFLALTSGSFYLGIWKNQVNGAFTGLMDELRVWNRSLTSNEIYEQYASNLQKFNSTDWELYVNQSKNSTDGLGVGTYTYQAFGKDATGNTNSTEQRTVIINEADTTAPVLGIQSPANTTYATTNISINLSATDATAVNTIWYYNGTANLTYSVNTSVIYANGQQTFIAYANDSAGNRNETKVVFFVDSVVPILGIQSPENKTYSITNISINLSATDTNLNTIWYYNGTANLTYTVNTSIIYGQGQKVFIAYANDSAGNRNETKITFLVDNLNGSIVINSPRNITYAQNNISINLSGSDSNLDSIWFYNGTKNVTYTVNTSVIYANGQYTLFAYINDSAGNLNWTSVVFLVDGSKPSLIVYYPMNKTYFGSQNISINISASDSNLDSKWFYNGTANLTYSQATSMILDYGTHTFIAYANDSAGNLNWTKIIFAVSAVYTAPGATEIVLHLLSNYIAPNSAAITLTLGGDVVAPGLTIQSPENKTYSISNISINISGRGNYVWYYNGTANLTFSINTSIVYGQGQQTFIAYSNDSAGNRNETKAVFVVDTIIPVLGIQSPANTTYATTNISINLSAIDSNLGSIWFYNGTKNVTYTVNTSVIYANGQYTFIAYANDSAGNRNETKVVFVVDTTADCSNINPTTISECTSPVTLAGNARYGIPMNFTNTTVKAQNINISSGAYVIYRNVTLYVKDLIVDKGGKVEFLEGSSTVWHNGDWNISGTSISNTEKHIINGTFTSPVGINVLGSGNLTIYDNSNITGGEDITAYFAFNVFGNLTLKDSSITGMKSRGIDIFANAGDVRIGNISFATMAMNPTAISMASNVKLIGDIRTDYYGINISGNNLRLDCNSGAKVNYSLFGASYGINLDYANGTNIKNCYVAGGSNSMNSHGININYAWFSNMTNVIVSTIGSSSYGINFAEGGQNNFTNVTIDTTGTTGYGLYLFPAFGIAINNRFKNGRITTLDSTAGNAYLSSSASRTEIINSNLTAKGGANAIYLSGSHNNTFANNSVSSIGGFNDAISISGDSDNNIIDNNTIYSAGGDGIDIASSGGFPPSYPTLNNVSRNTFNSGSITGYDININADDTFGGTWLIDQIGKTNDYSFTSTNLVVQESSYGRINWFMGISETSGNLSQNISITNNSALVRTSSTMGFNQSANVTFFNFGNRGYASPAILRDGSVCSACYNFTALTASTVIFNVTGWSNYSIGEGLAAGELSSCGNLTSANTVYNLTQNLSGAGTCISVGANNVSLDCVGYSIAYASSVPGYGVENPGGYSNFSLKGCKITQAGGGQTNSHGVLLSGQVGGVIEFNNITTNGGSSVGVYLSNSNQTNVTSNNISSLAGGEGIYVVGSRNILFGNKLSTFSDAIYVYGDSDYNTISNNTIYSSGDDGIELAFNGASSYPNLNNLTGNVFKSTTNQEIEITSDGTAVGQGTWLIDQAVNKFIFSSSYLEVLHSTFGHLRWLSVITATGNNLSSNVTFRNDSIFVDSNQIGLNLSANVSLFGIGNRGFTIPGVLKDGATCAGCYNFSALTALTVVFNVTGWSNYSIGEQTDIWAPTYSGNSTSPASSAMYFPGQNYQMNVTWTDTYAVDTVIITFNGTNTTLTSSGGGVYSFTKNNLRVGNYPYYWWANDSSGNTNITQIYTYIISLAPGAVTATIDGARANKTVNEGSVVALGGTLVNGTGSIYLYENYDLINTGTSPLSNSTNYTKPGTYIIKTQFYANENYTAGLEQFTLTVSDTHSPVVYFTNNTLINNTEFENNVSSIDINFSIVESAVSDIKIAWNLTNYSIYDNYLLLMHNYDNATAGTSENDLSTKDNDGVLVGSVGRPIGKYGRGVNFTGSDYVMVNPDSNDNLVITNNSMTIEAWINTSAAAPTSFFTSNEIIDTQIENVSITGGINDMGGTIKSLGGGIYAAIWENTTSIVVGTLNVSQTGDIINNAFIDVKHIIPGVGVVESDCGDYADMLSVSGNVYLMYACGRNITTLSIEANGTISNPLIDLWNVNNMSVGLSNGPAARLFLISGSVYGVLFNQQDTSGERILTFSVDGAGDIDNNNSYTHVIDNSQSGTHYSQMKPASNGFYIIAFQNNLTLMSFASANGSLMTIHDSVLVYGSANDNEFNTGGAYGIENIGGINYAIAYGQGGPANGWIQTFSINASGTNDISLLNRGYWRLSPTWTQKVRFTRIGTSNVYAVAYSDRNQEPYTPIETFRIYANGTFDSDGDYNIINKDEFDYMSNSGTFLDIRGISDNVLLGFRDDGSNDAVRSINLQRQTEIYRYRSYYLYALSGTAYAGFMGNPEVSASHGSGWHHYAATFSSSGNDGIRLYIDGVLAASANRTNDALSTYNETLYIGRGVSGTLDNVRIWNRALSNDEISLAFRTSLIKTGESTWQTETIRNINSEGNHTLQVCVYDTGGSMGCTEPLFYTMLNDTNTPLIEFIAPTPESGLLINGSSFIVNVSVTEAHEDTIIFRLLNSTKNLVNQTASTSRIRSLNYTGLAGGPYFFNVSVNDSYGNTNSTATRNITFKVTFITPGDSNTAQYNISGSVNGYLYSGGNYSVNQFINFSHPTHGIRARFEALFASENVNISSLVIEQIPHKTSINKTGVSGIALNHTLYVPRTINNGVYVCPNAKSVYDAISSCSGIVSFTDAEASAGTWKSSYYAFIEGSNYGVANVTGSGISENITDCGAYTTNVTMNADVYSRASCMILSGEGTTLDCAGNTIYYCKVPAVGGAGVLVDMDNITIKNCKIITDTTGGGNYTLGVWGISSIGNSTLFVNNTIITNGSGGADGGIYIYYSYKDAVIENNTIYVDTFNSAYGYGIRLTNSRQINISNNVINITNNLYSGSFPFIGIYSLGNEKLVIKNNVINMNASQTNGHLQGVFVSDYAFVTANNYSENNSIIGNRININSNANGYADGIVIGGSNRSIVSSNSVNARGSGKNNIGIYADSFYSLIEYNNISANGSGNLDDGIVIESSDSLYNILLNNNFVNISGITIYQEGDNSSLNYLVYNNSHGEIKWSDETFLRDIDFSGNLTFPGAIIVSNNSAYFNAGIISMSAGVLGTINSSANITLYNVGNRGFTSPAILRDSAVCSACYNFTSLTASTVIFNVSGWSNYSIGEGAVNNAPTVVLDMPFAGNKTMDRTPRFDWNGSDADGDPLTYVLNVSLVASSTCTDTEKYITGIVDENYTLASDLNCLYDNGDYYMWSVRADDTKANSSWAGPRTINISSLVQITLSTNAVEFGMIHYQGQNDTSDDKPAPFVVQNDGNSYVNISVDATNLWNTIANPNNYYMFAANTSAEGSSAFDWTPSITGFSAFQLTGSATNMTIVDLNYADATDSAELEVYVQVPPEEGSNVRSSVVKFTASLSE